MSESKEYSIVDASHIYERWVIVDPRDISRRMEMKNANDFALHLFELTDENACLKAEVEELKSQPDPLTAYLYAAELAKDEVKRLKAEVEKLTFDPMSYLDDQGEWMPRYTHLVAVERLKAEIERLKDEVGLMNQLFEKHMTPEIRKAMVKAVNKGRRS